MHNTSLSGRDSGGESGFVSIVHMLERRAVATPDEVGFRFFSDSAVPAAEARFDAWTWRELRERARGVERALRAEGAVAPGARILVVYPPGLDFIAAFFGCLYAGAVPVPAPAPRRADGIERWLHVARDAGICGVLCPADLVEPLLPLQQAVGRGFCFAPAAADAAAPWCTCDERPFVPPGARQVAFLQYTSGSTSNPKGVMVTHGNLMANLRQISVAFAYSPQDRSACWLPHYHDMGLIDGILSPVFNGFPVSLMAPASFLRRPLRFLDLASQCRATVIGGPNFSYEHCVEKFTPEAAAGLDLSAIRIAYNGAEPIRPHTLRRFASTFASSGFRWEAFYCCYGQAEATLFQTGNGPADPPAFLAVRREDLSTRGVAIEAEADGEKALELAACGRPADGLDLALVDPEQRQRVADGIVGEIWIRGPNVTPGYWGRAQLNAETFDQRLDGAGGWRRTGDLGFRVRGQIYIAGRLKDLIIVRGQNHHPEDIEQSVFSCHPALAQGRAGVFPIEIEGEEQVGIACELTRDGLRDLPADEVLAAIRGAVSRSHSLKAGVIALLRPGSLPRTPSGKVRRFACRQGVADGALRIVARWDAQPGAALAAPALQEPVPWREQLRDQPRAFRRDGLRRLIRQEVALLARLAPGELPEASTGFFDLGLDSVALVNIGATLERELALQVKPTLIFEHPTIEALTDYLHGVLDAGFPDLPVPHHGALASVPGIPPSGASIMRS
ncbi:MULTISPECIES: AMP-binding protein [unclassified Xanthobacter]|uniref:AMP-binding protein n=1 Tax=unclassified Xanthobacter TaxID=2623496 RepID=UPI001EDF7828|nr:MULTISPECIES: AMP-binding protein [unclassified Xanthobacter]